MSTAAKVSSISDKDKSNNSDHRYGALVGASVEKMMGSEVAVEEYERSGFIERVLSFEGVLGDRNLNIVYSPDPLGGFRAPASHYELESPKDPDRESRVRELVDKVQADDGASCGVGASDVVAVSAAVELSPFLEEASRPGSTLPRDLLEVCNWYGVRGELPFYTGCVAFRVFAHVGFEDAATFVLRYVSHNVRGGWATSIASRALEVLTHQRDDDFANLDDSPRARYEVLDKAIEFFHPLPEYR